MFFLFLEGISLLINQVSRPRPGRMKIRKMCDSCFIHLQAGPSMMWFFYACCPGVDFWNFLPGQPRMTFSRSIDLLDSARMLPLLCTFCWGLHAYLCPTTIGLFTCYIVHACCLGPKVGSACVPFLVLLGIFYQIRLLHSSLVDYLAQVINLKICPTTFYCIFQLVWVPMTTTQNIRVCFLSSNNTLFS